MPVLSRLIAISAVALSLASLHQSGSATAVALAHDGTADLAARAAHHEIAAKYQRRDTSLRKRCKAKAAKGSTSSSSSSKPDSNKKPDNTKANSNTGNNSPPKTDPKPKTQNKPPSTAPATTGGGKIGLAWPNGNNGQIHLWKNSKVAGLYTWSAFCPDEAHKIGLPCFPMLWGAKNEGDFNNQVKPGGGPFLMGQNEPNLGSQSNLSPGDACAMWKRDIQWRKSQGYRTISPAVTSAPDGKTWLQSFFNQGCDADVVAIHWYGTKFDQFKSYVTDFHNTFGREIMITEFAVQDFTGGPQASQAQVTDFMRQAKNFLDNASFVGMYFWFGVMHDMVGVNPANQLMGPDGGPNDLGRLYLS